MKNWIKVQDKLPDPYTYVLIYTDWNGGCVEYGYYSLLQNSPHWVCVGTNHICNVSYWMSLPTPPMEHCRMTNIEKLQNMDPRQFADFIYYICDECQHCPCKSTCNHMYRQELCTENFIEWLERDTKD